MSRNDGSGGDRRMPSVIELLGGVGAGGVAADRGDQRAGAGPTASATQISPSAWTSGAPAICRSRRACSRRRRCRAAGAGGRGRTAAADRAVDRLGARSMCGVRRRSGSPMSISPATPGRRSRGPRGRAGPARTSRSTPRPSRRRAALLSAPEPSSSTTSRFESPCVYSCQTVAGVVAAVDVAERRAARRGTRTGTSASAATGRRAACPCSRCRCGRRPGRRRRPVAAPSTICVQHAGRRPRSCRRRVEADRRARPGGRGTC